MADRHEFSMRVKLVWIERDFRGKELSKREEILHGESAKNPTRNHIARLIARHHPELQFVGKVLLLNASKEGHKWYVKATKLDPNRWLYAYADPLDQGNLVQTESHPDESGASPQRAKSPDCNS